MLDYLISWISGHTKKERHASYVQIQASAPLSPLPRNPTNPYWDECKSVLTLGWPLLLTYACHASTSLVAIYFVGQLSGAGADELAAVALATTFVNITGFSVAYGMASALDTLASQFAGSVLGTGGTATVQSPPLELRRDDVEDGAAAHSPHADYGQHHGTEHIEHQLGVLLQRSMCVMALTAVPITVLWWNSAALLHSWARQPASVAALAGQYTAILSFGLVPYFFYECIKRYLLALNHSMAPLLVMACMAAMNVATHALLCRSDVLGFHGSAVAMALSYSLTPLLAVVYMRHTGCHLRTWGGWSRQALTHWWPYLRLAIPGTLMICAEWWAFEICALLAGVMGTNSLAAHSIVQTTVYALYMVPFGLASAVTVRVGNLLGIGDFKRAQLSTRVTLMIVAGSMVVNGVLIYSLRYNIGDWFAGDISAHEGSIDSNADVSVVALVAAIAPITAIYQVFDGTQAVCSGILRGCGHQMYAASATLFAYYAIGIPVALYLGFHRGMGVVGLWWGIFAAVTVLAACLVLKVLFGVRWDVEARRAATGQHYNNSE